jgi:hypothetical protein
MVGNGKKKKGKYQKDIHIRLSDIMCHWKWHLVADGGTFLCPFSLHFQEIRGPLLSCLLSLRGRFIHVSIHYLLGVSIFQLVVTKYSHMGPEGLVDMELFPVGTFFGALPWVYQDSQ